MERRREREDGRAGRKEAPAGARGAAGPERTGLAIEGPGFLVWDEIASDARRRAGELRTAALWWKRSAARRF